MKIRTTNESGMTLLELMFAAGILALTLSFLFGSIITVTTANGATDARVVAMAHATSIMEELRGCTYAQILAYAPPTFPNALPGETVTLKCFKSDGSSVTLPASPTGLVLPDPLTVECTISFKDTRGHAMQSVVQGQFRT